MKRFFVIILFLCGLYTSASAQLDNYNVSTIIENVSVTDITGDENYIWIATNGSGVFRYSLKEGKIKQFSSSKGDLANNFIYSIAESDRYVWAGSIDGLFMYDKRRDNWNKRKFGKGGQLSNWIRSLAFDESQNTLWIGRFKYLTKLDIRSRRFTDYDLTIGNEEKTNTIKSIAVDGDSLIWFGTEAGLHKYNKSLSMNDQNALSFYDNKLSFFNGEGEQVSISDILFERNNIWIGLDEFLTKERPEFNIGGLYEYNRKNKWVRFDNTNGLPANGIFCLERTGNYIWVSLYQFGKATKDLYGRGLVLINRLTNEIKVVRNENIPDTIFSIYFDGSNVWLGTDSGLIKVEMYNKLAVWN